MENEKASELSNQNDLKSEKKRKTETIVNAVFIGAMIGIVIFSILKNTIGLVSLIPLYFIYRGFSKSNNK